MNQKEEFFRQFVVTKGDRALQFHADGHDGDAEYEIWKDVHTNKLYEVPIDVYRHFNDAKEIEDEKKS